MPWDADSFKKHNHGLTYKEAGKAAKQANAILEKTGDEGLAIATANRDSKKHKHPSQKESMAKMYGKK